jgi:hypothetical protein
VVSNLIGNAVKYAPDGSIHVRLSTEAGFAALTVRDEGPGIPPNRLETVFEPYVRLTADQGRPAPQGSGLGLFIARRIVEAHGGRIWAESVPGQGATFNVRLPLTPVPAATPTR